MSNDMQCTHKMKSNTVNIGDTCACCGRQMNTKMCKDCKVSYVAPVFKIDTKTYSLNI